MALKKYVSVEDYHADFPVEIREKLDLIRQIIKDIAPGATAQISYNMPTFKQKDRVVYYSAFKKHVSLFPAPGGDIWDEDFKPYKTSGKGTIQFPYDKPIPVELVKKIVTHLLTGSSTP